MAVWETNMVLIVRGLINDLVSPYTYSDDRLKELICLSGVLTQQEVTFDVVYTISLSLLTITPDPSAEATYDADFEALVSLKTACIILSSEYTGAARAAMNIKDGPSTIDTRDRAKHLGENATDACDNYNKALTNYRLGDGSVGKAIVSPYATGRYSNEVRRFN